MRKSKEQKAVDTLVDLVADSRFREFEFINILSQQPIGIMRRMFGIILAFAEWYAISADNQSYQSNEDKSICEKCQIIRDSVGVKSNDYIRVLTYLT